MPSEPTRHQLSSRLAYSQTTPSFIQKLRNQVEGVTNTEEEDEFDKWQASSGRPPIPQRPSIPERPADDPGSADEDDDDERPQVVVLKQGKHMSALEVENEKRRAQGLPPRVEASYSDVSQTASVNSGSRSTATVAKAKTAEKPTLSFTSSNSGSKASSKKRKAAGIVGENDKETPRSDRGTQKKAKKAGKALLSFGDGHDD